MTLGVTVSVTSTVLGHPVFPEERLEDDLKSNLKNLKNELKNKLEEQT